MDPSLIKEGAFEPRAYQTQIAQSALSKGNTLVILPTGLGKTIVALVVMDAVLARRQKVLFLAPTKPLAEQHRKKILASMKLNEEEVALLTGEKTAKDRIGDWGSARVVVATPQTVKNDIGRRRASLDNFGLAVFDEAHRTIGNYAYTFVADECAKNNVLVLGLTASPGGKEEKIREITETLKIKNIEIRTETDEDVEPYVQPLDAKWIELELPAEFVEVKRALEEIIIEKTKTLTELGYLYGNFKIASKRALLDAKRKLDAQRGRNPRYFIGMTTYAMLFNLVHAHELLETQGPGTFLEFFRRMGERVTQSKAVKTILANKRIHEILAAAEKLSEHPKLDKLRALVEERKGKTLIVFVQYRDQIKHVVGELNKLEGVRAVQFVGKREGVSQKLQKETIEKFRRGEFNVLVASSIGEEGLDIPSVDCVIFYEPIASEIRSIQRRGRAGRAKAGEVIVLITKGTRDEAYYWVAQKKEKRMRRIVKRMQLGFEGKGRTTERKKKVRVQSKMTDYFG